MFYDRYLSLCNKAGKTPSGAALEMGLSKPTVNRWKNGGGITDANAKKIADYFGITVSELTGEGQKKSSLPDGREHEDKETIELREIWASSNQEDREFLIATARMLKARRKNNDS